MTFLLGAQVAERTAIGFYLVYAVVAVGLVMYLARTLRRNGGEFLVDVFDQPRLADAVNQLLVIGFYLLNLGYAFVLFQLQPSYESHIEAFNQLTLKIGVLLLSLGIIHLLNMAVFWRIRTHRDRRYAAKASNYPPPPPAPTRPSAPTAPAGPSATVAPG